MPGLDHVYYSAEMSMVQTVEKFWVMCLIGTVDRVSVIPFVDFRSKRETARTRFIGKQFWCFPTFTTKNIHLNHS